MKRIIVVALVTIAAASVAAGQCVKPGKMMHDTATVEAIKRLETERNKVLVAGDIAAIDRLYSDDYTSAVDSTSRTKSEVLADLKSGALKLAASSNDETNVRVYGMTAVVTGKSTLKRTDRGTEINGQVYFTRVWVKQMGRWRLVANHASSVTR
jgi:ketosteroid isomerase-like protein